ncbi:MAG: CopD family protein [Alphaproteobacteria bacterium]|nr:CopD family protein [Alphaproteobacteria bacterium]
MGTLVALHALAAAIWVGGMAFAHFCLRPAARSFDPPVRLRLMTSVLDRFFRFVWGAIALLLLTGYGILAMRGFDTFGLYVHLMQAAGIVMMLLFAHLWFAPWRRLQRAVGDADWPAAARQLDQIRQIVAINLMLGTATVLLGAGGRWL